MRKSCKGSFGLTYSLLAARVAVGLTIFNSVVVLIISSFFAMLGCQPGPESGPQTSSANSREKQITSRADAQPPMAWIISIDKVALSSDGKHALFAYKSRWDQGKFKNWVRLWDVEKGLLICTLGGLVNTPQFVGFSEDGSIAIVGKRSGEICLYQIPSGKLLHNLRVSPGGLIGMVVSADGRLAAIVGTDISQSNRLCAIWDLTKGKLLRELNPAAAEGFGAISPDHRLAVATARTKPTEKSFELNIIEIASGRVRNRLPYSDGWTHQVQFASDSIHALVVKRSRLQYLAYCEIGTGKILWSTEQGVSRGRILKGDNRVMVETEKHTWQTLDAGTGKVISSITIDHGFMAAQTGGKVRAGPDAYDFSSDGKIYLAVMGSNQELARFSSGRRDLTVKVFRCENDATLVKTWHDSTNAYGG